LPTRHGALSETTAFRHPRPRRLAVGDTAQLRPSRNQIVLVLVLVLDCPVSDYEDDDDDDDEKFARPATIRTDTDRQGCLRYNPRSKALPTSYLLKRAKAG